MLKTWFRFSRTALGSLTTLTLVTAAVTTIVGINLPTAEAIAIDHKGVKIEDNEEKLEVQIAQEGEPIPDIDVKLGKKPRTDLQVQIAQEGEPILDVHVGFSVSEGDPIPDLDVKLGR